MKQSYPWWSYPLLLSPSRIQEALDTISKSPGSDSVNIPNLWQVGLGVLRMYHRLVFRSETIGTCPSGAVRSTWRSKMLRHRMVRGPVLWSQGAIAPFDLSGLSSSTDRIVQHLLAAHHDGHQFAYDLEILAIWPHELERLEARVEGIINGRDPRSEWYKDLAIYDGYHQHLLEAVRQIRNPQYRLPEDVANDPDISFLAYLKWCARQPETPLETIAAWRRGSFSMPGGRTT